jgi:hypothetical protein
MTRPLGALPDTALDTTEAQTLRERAANVIDVHKLAGELGVSAAVILQAVAELHGTVNTGSTLTDELASQVRTHLRSAQGGFVGSGGSPMFSVGAQHSVASRPENRTIAPAFGARDLEDPPRQQGYDPDRATGGSTSSDDERLRRASETVREDALASQLAAQAASSVLAAEWRAAGLGAHDGHIIEQCQRHGLTPEDLRRRVDGQTVASRLKNGESISSVRSRIAQSN